MLTISPHRELKFTMGHRVKPGGDDGDIAASTAFGYLRRTSNAPVAQLDRALPSEGRGQGFESLRARQSLRIAAQVRKNVPNKGFLACPVVSLGGHLHARFVDRHHRPSRVILRN